MKLALLLSSLVLLAAAARAEEPRHPTLRLGSPAPDFKLPGADGKTHRLSDFRKAKILAVIFTCNHCPTAQAYEERIKQLVTDYKSKGVAVVAINPNSPTGVRLDVYPIYKFVFFENAFDVRDQLPLTPGVAKRRVEN